MVFLSVRNCYSQTNPALIVSIIPQIKYYNNHHDDDDDNNKFISRKRKRKRMQTKTNKQNYHSLNLVFNI